MKVKSKKITKNNKAKLSTGTGGEIHQESNSKFPTLTTQQGMPVSDDQNSLRAGDNGPALLEDHHLREKLFHFDHERIPERVVHARGFGAHGYFENYENLSAVTKADIFQRKGEKIPAFVRFSTVAGNKGSADLARDVRGFAVKLYTKQGNWDIVGNNIPVFFIQDAIKFPDLIHAAKAEPDCDFPQAQTAHDNFWDFISLMPESMNMIMWIMSDRTLPRSFRFMEGFGVHTFRMINEKNQSTFVKFHWKPKLGLQSVIWNEAVKINGADPDFHRRDLWNTIKSGKTVEWELGLQLFDESFAKKFPFDVLDPTKLIPVEDVPLKMVGKLVLNRCVDNFFAETEQVAFCTQNIVPGIDFSNDPLLQGRNFSYLDTQIKRLGSPNFSYLPINAPKCPMHLFQQDGHMTFANPKGRVNYEPNSWEDSSTPRENPRTGFQSFAEPMHGCKERKRSESFSDHYSQARQFYISQTLIEQQHLANALIFELSKVEKSSIRERIVSHLFNIDETLGTKVLEGLGLKSRPNEITPHVPVNRKLKPINSLSIMLNGPNSFEGRKIGLLLSNGSDAKLVKAIISSVKKAGGTVEIITSQISGVKLSDDSLVKGDQILEGAPSVLYDAIILALNENSSDSLLMNIAIRDFISDAYYHYKFLGYTNSSYELIKKIIGENELDDGCIALSDRKSIDMYILQCGQLRYWDREKIQ